MSQPPILLAPANTGRVLRLCRSSLIYRSKPKSVGIQELN